jgi:hypothetical protein
MLGSVVLDVAVGLVSVYLLLSLICSAIRESIEARLKTRAVHLEAGIREMLGDPDGSALAKKVYEHPLVYSLFKGAYTCPGDKHRWWWLGTVFTWIYRRPLTHLPSYIPARNFALALLDLAGRGDAPNPGRQPATGQAQGKDPSALLSVDQVRSELKALDNPRVQRVVLTALDTARGDMETAIRNLETWYDSGMDRVSGWYKRDTQQILFWLGLILAVLLNVDTLAIVRHLSMNEQARAAIVQQAAEAVKADSAIRKQVEADRLRSQAAIPASPAPAAGAQPGAAGAAPADAQRGVKGPDGKGGATPPAPAQGTAASEAEKQVVALSDKLLGLSLPVGWGQARPGIPRSEQCIGGAPWLSLCSLWPHDDFPWVASLLGWLITAFALSFGAPFWFDLLNKMMVIRSTVKPHEKSPEEGSEDRAARRSPPAPSPALAPSTAPATGGASPQGAT